MGSSPSAATSDPIRTREVRLPGVFCRIEAAIDLAGTERLPGALRQLGDGQEFKALCPEPVDDPRRGVHRAGVHVVQQDDAAVVHLAADPSDDGVRVPAAPVFGVHRPEDDGKTRLPGSLAHAAVQRAAGRPHQHRRDARIFADQRRRLRQFIPKLVRGHGVEAAVAVAVDAQLMARPGQGPAQLRVGLDPVTAEEKRCVHLPVGEHIEKGFGVVAAGAVVKAQGHPARGVRLPRQDHQRQHGANQLSHPASLRR